MSSDSESSDDCCEIVTEKIKEVTENFSLNLSEESRRVYTGTYNTFKKWCTENDSNFLSEDIMLAYFNELSKKYAASSLWSTYSMLRSTINFFDQVDISSYKLLIYFLKKQSSGYQPKKSLVFTKENISKFLNEAPDDIYLSTKVALIFGIAGALKRKEFVNLKINDVTEVDNLLLIKVTKSTDKVIRTFTVTDKLCDITKQYMQLRPPICETNRFFLQYSKGRCLHQPIGINKFGALPKEVALYLKLTNADKYTGHSFRKTSVTVLVEAGANIMAIRRQEDCKSCIITEDYNADSLNKKRLYQQISSETVLNNKQIKISNVVPNTVTDPLDLMSTSVQPDVLHETNRNVSVTGNSIVTNSSISDPFQQNLIHETNKNVSITRNTIEKNSPISNPIRVSSCETNRNVTAIGNSIIDTSTENNQIQQIEQVICNPVIDFCSQDVTNESTNKNLQFSNCNVTIDGSSYHSMVFSNCNVTITGSSRNSIVFNNCNVTNKYVQNDDNT